MAIDESGEKYDGRRNNPGGYRGGGRPAKSVEFKTPIANANRLLAEHLPQVVENLKRLADGVYYEKDLGDGEEIIYKTLPDIKANQYIADRIMGKPTQAIEHSGEVKTGPFDHMDDDELKRYINEQSEYAPPSGGGDGGTSPPSD